MHPLFPSNPVPKKLKEVHKLAALLCALGWRARRVAKTVGLHENRLSIVRKSPAFQLLVDQYQRDFITKGITTTVDKILADGPANVDFLRDVRDGVEKDAMAIDEPDARLRLRLDAAGKLLDRQAPRRQESQTDHRVHFVVEARQRVAAEDACIEVGEPIEMEAKPTLLLSAVTLTARPLDEVIQEYEAREAEA